MTIQENDLDLSLFGSFQAGELYIIYIYYVCMYAHYIIYLIRFLVGLDGYVRNYFQYLNLFAMNGGRDIQTGQRNHVLQGIYDWPYRFPTKRDEKR